jgi:protein SCO1
MKFNVRKRSLISVLLPFIVLAGQPSLAGETGTTLLPRAARVVDLPLVDAYGKRYRFLSDLVSRSPVLVSFTFTGCRSLCPPADLVMDSVAARMRDRGIDHVRLLTITLDPLTDTPAQLRKERADMLDPARLFLTGEPQHVWSVLSGLGIEGGVDQDHDAEFLLITSGGTAIQSMPGLPDPDVLVETIEKLR